jgi:predicted transcriptional regulator
MTKETLEDVAQSYAVNKKNRTSHYMGFIEGAKWMEKQMENLKDFDTWKEWKNETK